MDPDVGSSSLKSYALGKNARCFLQIKPAEGGKSVLEHILEKPLDCDKRLFTKY